MPVYVWPAKEKYEFRLLNSGITGLTDNLDPNFTWYDDGHPRWRFPATQPLDNEQLNQMANIEYENHNDLLKEFSLNVPTWSEADHSRRNEITKMCCYNKAINKIQTWLWLVNIWLGKK